MTGEGLPLTPQDKWLVGMCIRNIADVLDKYDETKVFDAVLTVTPYQTPEEMTKVWCMVSYVIADMNGITTGQLRKLAYDIARYTQVPLFH